MGEQCATCGGRGLVSYSGRGEDGPDPCPDCGPPTPPPELLVAEAPERCGAGHVCCDGFHDPPFRSHVLEPADCPACRYIEDEVDQ